MIPILLTLGCNGSGTDCAGTDYQDHPLCTEWVLNTTAASAVIVDDGEPVLTDIQGVSLETGEAPLVRVQATGIPSYQLTLDQDDIDWLNGRPLAEDDFLSGATTAQAGETVEFGQDIGYDSNNNCGQGEGFGFWPPGPECPFPDDKEAVFPLEPTPAADSDCQTGLGAVGWWVNGVSLYNWWDGQAYDQEGDWLMLAPVLEQYDVDLCAGHAASGDYHHHDQPPCVAELVGDNGDGHSPVYGFAADGYPVHGPWYDDGELARSCWIFRNYDDPYSESGCGVAGERSCVLVDPYDLSQGTEPAADGPSTSDTVTSLSGNSFTADQGLFMQDYWYDADCTAEGGAALDAFNGHDHDALGYHYHLTQEERDDGSLRSAFPFILGPAFYGELPEGALAECSDNELGGPPRGGP